MVTKNTISGILTNISFHTLHILFRKGVRYEIFTIPTYNFYFSNSFLVMVYVI